MSPDLRRFSFAQFDVFSSHPFEGNSLAVLPNARGLSDQQMQAIAREMNLSETTFILPRDPKVERERGVRVRIFTVQEEYRLPDIRLWARHSCCAARPEPRKSDSI